MPQPAFHFDDAVFTYAVAPQPVARFSRSTPVLGGALTVSHTSKTEVRSAREGEREAVVIGLCVDAHGEIQQDSIPDWILSQPQQDILSVYRSCGRFAGKYAILYQNEAGRYLFSDATAALQINYGSCAGSACAASLPKLAADVLGTGLSDRGVKIRKGSTLSQPMPNDLTEYEGVRCLLPNHYLDWTRQKASRVPLGIRQASSEAEIRGILERTAALSRTVTQAYTALYPFALPLTAGTDSRVILSFLKEYAPNLECYTYNHARFTPDEPDITIPKKLCELCGLSYHIIDYQEAPSPFLQAAKEVIGEYCDPFTVNLSYTFRTRFPNQAALNGAVIDEVGKSTQENTVPARLLNTPYFMCKLHNYEPLTRGELDAYRKGILSAGEGRHMADLFAMELKLGRRVGLENAESSICGVTSLNIFNCRELILQWARIPRSIRVQKAVHKDFLRRNDPQLLDLPFNPGSGLVSTLKKTWPTFYLGTFAKYHLLRRKKGSGLGSP